MIVVDTSALMSILLDEPQADVCTDALSAGAHPYISADTLAEALIVADRRRCGQERRRLIDGLGFNIVSITLVSARVADAHARWGKGIDPAGLNFGDCFAYALASETGSPLLYVGDDFAATDRYPAIPPQKGDDVPESTSQPT